MTVLACDPDELVTAAAGLRRAAAELERAAPSVRAAEAQTWQGPAALAQAARRAEAASTIGALAGPVEQLAGGLTKLGTSAREQAEIVRHHTFVRDRATQERLRLLAAGAALDPATATLVAQRVVELEQEERRADHLIHLAEQEFDRAQREIAHLLDAVRDGTPQVIWDLALLVGTVYSMSTGWRNAATGAAAVHATRRLRRVAGRSAERTIHQVRTRLDQRIAAAKLRPWPFLGKLPGGAALVGRAVPVVALVDAGRGLLTGGGYDGWRGGVTRGLAGAAMVGAGVAIATGVLAVGVGPVVGVVGLGAVATYQVWTAGNWIYDRRQQIADTAVRAGAAARATAAKAWASGTEQVTRARDSARSGFRRIRTGLGKAARDLWGSGAGAVGATT